MGTVLRWYTRVGSTRHLDNQMATAVVAVGSGEGLLHTLCLEPASCRLSFAVGAGIGDRQLSGNTA